MRKSLQNSLGEPEFSLYTWHGLEVCSQICPPLLFPSVGNEAVRRDRAYQILNGKSNNWMRSEPYRKLGSGYSKTQLNLDFFFLIKEDTLWSCMFLKIKHDI